MMCMHFLSALLEVQEKEKKQTTWTFEHAEVNTMFSSNPLTGQRYKCRVSTREESVH